MPFELFERVHIKDKDVTGDIVDIYLDDDGQKVYTVQSHKQGYVNDPDAYTGEYPLYDVHGDRLAKLR
mgnify:CR=1 FL=1